MSAGSDVIVRSESRQGAPPWLHGALVLVLVTLTFLWVTRDAGAGLVGAIALDEILRAGWLPLEMLVAAFGYGLVFRRWYAGAVSPNAIRLALGLALLLFVLHLAGMIGRMDLLTLGPAPLSPALLPGVVLAVVPLLRHVGKAIELPGQPPLLLWLALPAVVVLALASASPPGWLWNTEFGGYDALSYHLQLPKEWVRLGSLQPLHHNVYSYLPSGVESAYFFIASEIGLLENEARGAIACQMFHALLALAAAGMVAYAAMCMLERAGASSPMRSFGAVLAGVLTIGTPWSVVTGSLAYNEMAVVLFAAAALAVTFESGIPPMRRAALTALLAGAACTAKPTAMLFVTPAVGISLLAFIEPRRWVPVIAVGAGVGLVMLLPWLTRDSQHAGNPVFPHLTGLFGSGHWSDEQVARYARGHAFDGSLLDRLRLIVAPLGPDQPMRGMLHAQWGLLFPLALASGLIGLIFASTRRIAVLLLAGVIFQTLMWLLATHIQSRFLMPSLPWTVLLGVLPLALLREGSALPKPRGQAILGLISIAVVVQATLSPLVYTRQRGGMPNFLLLEGVGERLGTEVPAEGQMPTPIGVINRDLPRGSVVYLLGDATPFYLADPVIYHTTWDASPLGDMVRSDPGDPTAWTRNLGHLGISHVLVNFSELRRLTDDGWYDPDVTPDLVAQWTETLGDPLATWPYGVALYRLPPVPGSNRR